MTDRYGGASQKKRNLRKRKLGGSEECTAEKKLLEKDNCLYFNTYRFRLQTTQQHITLLFSSISNRAGPLRILLSFVNESTKQKEKRRFMYVWTVEEKGICRTDLHNFKAEKVKNSILSQFSKRLYPL